MNRTILGLPPKKPIPMKTILNKTFAGLLFAVIVGWSIYGIHDRLNLSRVFSERTIERAQTVIPQLIQLNGEQFGRIIHLIIETLCIAFTGSLMAAVLAVPLGFLTAKNMMGTTWYGKTIFGFFKLWLNATRTFPEILLALIFVASIGPNPFAGVLAIAIGSTGMLGKLYGETIETVDMKVVEAMEASGANRIQVLFYAILPQVLPQFISYAIYRFEIDVRASTILGVIGAGGIGTLIVISAANRNWGEVGLIILSIIIVVTIIDYFSAYTRKKLL
ncbi:phosphonate ABC transporter, permease protein PhnE [Halobacillus salinarum]|uniref:Phosphonate ABC transporter, permease protein PhnE n=1 Tax=Halobacillus salinarum TaxID=2932257 RepID=A0ABY4EHU5_9BACI|nr:phosphonate ABC transporter, permease protein PhnE [Halobacillus salinarum]UOQ43458.1 phosphonate ABC transporter, permease protein PhnE [Halobacillus salinarum]